MGIVVRVSPRRDRNSSGDAETIAQPSPAMSRPWRGRSTAEGPRHAAGVSRERCPQVLDQVDLVDLARGDGRPRSTDGTLVLEWAVQV